MGTPLILQVYHVLGVLQACAWRRPRRGPSAFKLPAATASLWNIPGATGTPPPRIGPWTFQDTAARVSEAGSSHGCTRGLGSTAWSRS